MYEGRVASVEDLGLSLQQARLALGMTQRDLAAAMDTTQKHVWEMESGKPLAALLRLFDAIRATGSELIIRIPEGPGDRG